MVAIPLLNGLKANNRADLRLQPPLNLEPKLIESGLSKGILRSPPGLVLTDATALGADRGGITRDGVHYRVIGSKLVSVSSGGVATVLGEVGNDSKPVSLDYSFDRLSIGSNQNLFYWDGSLSQVTDVDLGVVKDHIWVDGYFMTTDGVSVVVTELADPMAVDPLKYGSSEADPDAVKGLLRLPGEVGIFNRHTIEFIRNVGGNGFPFARILNAQINKGCIGSYAKCRFGDAFAFVGGGRNEALAVYVGGGGQAQQISIPEVDSAINALSAADQALIEVESRLEEGEERLYVHLPTVTYVFLPLATTGAGEPVWYMLGGGVAGDQRYPVRHFTLADGNWFCGTTAGAVARLDQTIQSQFGEIAGWRFDTLLVYNKGSAGIMGQLELTGMPGRTPFGTDPKAMLSFTRDGETFSQERAASMGGFGQRRERVIWRPNVRFGKYLGLRVRGANTAFASWAALEADIEALA
jgi:hypothetical protein